MQLEYLSSKNKNPHHLIRYSLDIRKSEQCKSKGITKNSNRPNEVVTADL